MSFVIAVTSQSCMMSLVNGTSLCPIIEFVDTTSMCGIIGGRLVIGWWILRASVFVWCHCICGRLVWSCHCICGCYQHVCYHWWKVIHVIVDVSNILTWNIGGRLVWCPCIAKRPFLNKGQWYSESNQSIWFSKWHTSTSDNIVCSISQEIFKLYRN